MHANLLNGNSKTKLFFLGYNLALLLIELPKDQHPTAWQFNKNAYASQAIRSYIQNSDTFFLKLIYLLKQQTLNNKINVRSHKNYENW